MYDRDKCKEGLKRRRLNRAKFIFDLKKKSKCSKCEETHPFCLEFHHRNQTETKRIMFIYYFFFKINSWETVIRQLVKGLEDGSVTLEDKDE